MLTASHLNVFYGDIQALWDVSFNINKGEIVTLVGSNGAGKSTVMKTIAGLLKPRSGNLMFKDIKLARLPAYKIVELGISLVPEGRRLFPEMTVLENLLVGASVKTARKYRQTNIEWIYELFPVLKERSKQQTATLSGGEQQMLAIGRALMAQPELLLIDEMSLGLSPLVAQQILQVLIEINKAKKLTIALVEQDVGLALSVANRGYVIENGRFIEEGDAKSLSCDNHIMEAYLGINFKGKQV